MHPETRRIIAAAAHRARTGACPIRLHALGSGESFEIVPTEDGFIDAQTDVAVRIAGDHVRLAGAAAIELRLEGDIGFAGLDPATGQRFSGRAGGGASVTLTTDDAYFQYAVVTAADQAITDDHLSRAERITP